LRLQHQVPTTKRWISMYINLPLATNGISSLEWIPDPADISLAFAGSEPESAAIRPGEVPVKPIKTFLYFNAYPLL